MTVTGFIHKATTIGQWVD